MGKEEKITSDNNVKKMCEAKEQEDEN